jgi:hypothetical protein
MGCVTPLGIETLLDYWTGDLPVAGVESVEEHLFACEPCATRLSDVEAIAAAVRRVTALGRFRAAVAPSVIEALAARGLRIRTYRGRAGETIPCGAAGDDELLVVRFPVASGGVPRIDVAVCDERWGELQRVVDVPVDRTRDEVVFAERVDEPRLRVAHVFRLRLLAIGAGEERELGRFALAHDPRGPPG